MEMDFLVYHHIRRLNVAVVNTSSRCGNQQPSQTCTVSRYTRADSRTETYAPTLLARRLRNIGEASNGSTYQRESQRRLPWRELLTRVLVRPVTLFSEPIISFSCTFLALQYGIYYLFFQAYPIIFDGALSRHEKITTKKR